VFGSREVNIQQMAKVGFLLNIVGAIIITIVVIWLLPFVFDLDIDMMLLDSK